MPLQELKDAWALMHTTKNFANANTWAAQMMTHLKDSKLYPIASGSAAEPPGMIADACMTSNALPLWVRTGNLFVSCQYTGEGSWVDLIAFLADKENCRAVTIISGRHGNEEGTHVDDAGKYFTTTCDDRAKRFVAENKVAWAKKVKAVSALSMVDVAHESVHLDTPYCSIAATSALAKRLLGQGRVVVLAWCYSIFHPFPFPLTKEEDAYTDKAAKAAVAQRGRAISDILGDQKWADLKDQPRQVNVAKVDDEPKPAPEPIKQGPCRYCECKTFEFKGGTVGLFPVCKCGHPHPVFPT